MIDNDSTHGLRTLVVVLTAVSAVLAAPTALAGSPAGVGTQPGSGADPSVSTQQSNLACLDMEQSEVRDQLRDIAEQVLDALPAQFRSVASGERVELGVGDTDTTYFGAVVSGAPAIETVQSGQLDAPTIVAETDCATVDRITASEETSEALARSLARGDITWQSASSGRSAALAYGSKAVQAGYIASSGGTGDTSDAVDGFVNGVLLR